MVVTSHKVGLLVESKLMCKYYTRAICIREDSKSCKGCPYYRVYLKENSKSIRAVSQENCQSWVEGS